MGLARAVTQPRALPFHLSKYRPHGDIVMAVAGMHPAAVRAAPLVRHAIADLFLHFLDVLENHFAFGQGEAQSLHGNLSRSNWLTSCTCSWPQSLTVTSCRRNFSREIPGATGSALSGVVGMGVPSPLPYKITQFLVVSVVLLGLVSC